MTTVVTQQQQPIRSTIPARLDRLRWSPFHTRLVLGLGTAWVLDGLSVTIASSASSKLTQPDTLNLTTMKAASIGTVYLVGEVVGALVFGRCPTSSGAGTCSVEPRGLPGRHRPDGADPEGSGLDHLPLRDTVHRRQGIGGEYSVIELGNRRDDARTPPGAPISGSTARTGSGPSSARSPPSAAQFAAAGRGLAGGVPGRAALAVVIIFVRRNLPKAHGGSSRTAA